MSPPPLRHAKLVRTKDGIVELRQKGTLLVSSANRSRPVGAAVSTETIARFLAEVSRNQRQHDNDNDSLADALPVQNTIRVQSAADSQATAAGLSRCAHACVRPETLRAGPGVIMSLLRSHIGA